MTILILFLGIKEKWVEPCIAGGYAGQESSKHWKNRLFGERGDW